MSTESVPSDYMVDCMRMKMASIINNNPKTREELTKDFGNVYDCEDIHTAYEIIGFAAPFVYVQDIATGKKGTLMFQHHPRFYFSFEEE
jgi:hypothetical protein